MPYKQYQNAMGRSSPSGLTRANVSGANVHSVRVIGYNDETNESVVNKETMTTAIPSRASWSMTFHFHVNKVKGMITMHT